MNHGWRALVGAWLLTGLSSTAFAQDCPQAMAEARALAEKLLEPDAASPDPAARGARDLQALAELELLLPRLAGCGDGDYAALHARWSGWSVEQRARFRAGLHRLPGPDDLDRARSSVAEIGALAKRLDEELALLAPHAEADPLVEPLAALRAPLLGLRAQLHMARGRLLSSAARLDSWSRAAADAEEAAALWQALGSSYMRVFAQSVQAEAEELHGDREAAESLWREVHRGVARLPEERWPDSWEATELRARSLVELADLLQQQGLLEEVHDALWSEAAWVDDVLVKLEQRLRLGAADSWWLASDSLWRVHSSLAWLDLSRDDHRAALERLDRNRAWIDELWTGVRDLPKTLDPALPIVPVRAIENKWKLLKASTLARAGRHEEAKLLYDQLELDDREAKLGKAESLLAVSRRGDADARQQLALALVLAREVAAGEHEPELLAAQASVVGRLHLERALSPDFDRRQELALAVAFLGDALRLGLDAAGRREAGLGELVGVETVAALARAQLESGEPLAAAATLATWQARDLRVGAEVVDEAELLRLAAGLEGGLLVLGCGADTFVAVHVARDGRASGANRIVKREQLRRLVEDQLLGAIARDDLAAARLEATELGRELGLLDGIETLREGGAGGRLLVLAHGLLERVPWTLVPPFVDAQGAPRHEPLVLPGATRATSEWTGAGGWRLLGRPTDAQGRPLLRSGDDELVELERIHRVWARDLDERTLADALRTTAPACLHIVTHLGFAASEGGARKEPRLASTRGGHIELRAMEELLARIHAEPRSYTAPQLVVLATCSSAEGHAIEGRAQRSLANAFLAHGAGVVVATLWPVRDAAARSWSRHFHAAIEAGATPAAAGAKAVAELRSEGHPASDWAAFRVMGRR